MGVNSVTLVGRAGRDPEVRYFESGSMVANLTMAVNRRSRDDEPDWFNLEIWGNKPKWPPTTSRKGRCWESSEASSLIAGPTAAAAKSAANR